MRKSKKGSVYPDNWKEISEHTKEEAGWLCIRCGAASEPGYILTVHHLDLDPSNSEWWNLAALCQRCHLVIQAKVVMERAWLYDHSEWFKPYFAGFIAATVLKENITRKEAMERMDELLATGQPWNIKKKRKFTELEEEEHANEVANGEHSEEEWEEEEDE